MRAKLEQSQNYKIRTHKKAGLSCQGAREHLERHIQVCTQDPFHCGGISSDILCMASACQNEPIPCPFS